jgi:oxygen-independent coproporphyrinogen-3 oxidase
MRRKRQARRALPFGVHLYVHVPFCARRCSYCDFAIAVRRQLPVDDYLAALDAELTARAITGPMATVYLGGGTPSRFGDAGIPRLIDTLTRHVRVSADAELTLEANPEDVTPAAAAAWRAAGVTRLSLGAQSFDDDVLRWMHRTHDARAIPAAIDAARAAGLDDLSLDLIFGVPDALHRDWDRDLRLLLDLAPTHASIYGLTVEPHTPLGRWTARGDATEAPEESHEREFLAAHDALTGAGFAHYEVSNYARPGHRARHNSAYWTGAPYLGVGPSAHGFDGATRRWNHAPYAEWHASAVTGRDPVAGAETLTPAESDAESVYLGLRTDVGLPLRPGEDRHVSRWLDAGWGGISHGRLVLTATGWLRLDALAASLTAHRSR